MPIYEFRCMKCGHLFEELFLDASERVELICPECQCLSCERVISRSYHAMGAGPGGNQPKITTKSCGPSNRCTTLDLPGYTR